MNPLVVETAWKEASAAIYSPLPGYCGTSGDIIETDDAIVVFLCEESQHKAGQYWLAQVRIEVDSPSLGDAAANLAAYSAAFTALATWLKDASAVNTAFAALDPAVPLNGFFVQSTGQGPRDDRWVAHITLIAGMEF